MTKDEALRLAEEALNTHRVNADGDMYFNITKVEQALAAIRAALAEPTVRNFQTVQTEALRLAEEAIMDELEAVTDEEFEDAAGKLDDALRAIWKALSQPTISENLIVEPTVSNSLIVQTEALRLAEEFLDIVWHDVSLNDWQWEKLGKVQDAVNAALVDSVGTTEKCVDETVECGHDCRYKIALEEWFDKTKWVQDTAQDDDIDKAWRSVSHTIPYDQFRIEIARAVLAKYKEKNQ